MKSIAVIGSSPKQSESSNILFEHAQFYKSASELAGIGEVEVKHVELKDLLIDISPTNFQIKDTANDRQLNTYDLIFFRGKLIDDLDVVYAVAQYAKINSVKTINDYINIRTLVKLAQIVNFYLSGLPFPRTTYGPTGELIHLIEGGEISLPFIYKSKYGVHGNDNYLIKSVEDVLKREDSRRMIAQQHIPNQGDYRVLIVGKQTLVIERTAVKGSHLNNTSKGAKAKIVPSFDKHIVNQCRELAKSYKMTVSGVDVIFESRSNKHFFLEINPLPQLKSGSFMSEKKSLVAQLIKEQLLD